MEFKGTKGNWHLQGEIPKKGKYEAEELMIDFSETETNCVSVYCPKWSSDSENLANAKLIAAAPDLLNELQRAKETLIQQGFTESSSTIIGINKAIEKALK